MPWLGWFVVLDLLCLVVWIALHGIRGKWSPRRSAGEPRVVPVPVPEVVVLFTAESASLSPGAARSLEPTMVALRASPHAQVVVVGSADDTGHLTRNQRLAWARAREVARYLESQGIAAQRVKAIALEPARGITASDRDRLRSVTVKEAKR